MRRSPRRALLAAMLALALASPAAAIGPRDAFPPGEGESNLEQTARQIYDLVVLRPMAVAQSVASFVAYPIVAPISWLLLEPEDATEISITQHGRRTFRRPLGEL